MKSPWMKKVRWLEISDRVYTLSLDGLVICCRHTFELRLIVGFPWNLHEKSVDQKGAMIWDLGPSLHLKPRWLGTVLRQHFWTEINRRFSVKFTWKSVDQKGAMIWDLGPSLYLKPRWLGTFQWQHFWTEINRRFSVKCKGPGWKRCDDLRSRTEFIP